MKWLRPIGLGALGLLIMAAVWELYKLLGPEGGVVVGGRAILPRTGERAMPHVWDMITRLGEPVTGRSGDPLWSRSAARPVSSRSRSPPSAG